MRSRRSHWIVILALTLLVLFLTLAAFVLVLRPVRLLTAAAAEFDAVRKRFAATPFPLSSGEIRELRTILNDAHIEKARELGVSGLDDSGLVRDACGEGRLVLLEENRFWRIQDLKNSLPYVTPDTYRLLELIGARFQERLGREDLPPFRYTISSVLRTREDHAHLQRINRNATRGVSSHEFGTTVDILFREFDYSAASPLLFRVLTRMPGRQADFRKAEFDALGMEYAWALKTILAKVLIELQREGKCYVILERRQPVFHVTLAGT